MGGHGRLPKPSTLKALQGTLRKDRVAQNEAPTLALPRRLPPPAWLSPLAADYWRRLIVTLRRMRCLGFQDLDLVAVLADQLALYESCTVALNGKDGLTFVLLDGDGNPRGLQQWPEIKIRAGALVEIRRLGEHFGLSPASRARVSAMTDAEVDPFAQFDQPIGPTLAFRGREGE